MTLEGAIAALQHAGFDIDVRALRDALWLTTQAHIEIDLGVAISQGLSDTGGRLKPRFRDTAERQGEDSSSATTSRAGGRADKTSVYPEFSGESMQASPIRVPGGPALPGRLRLLRSMRPFTERWPSRQISELDEASTVDAIAAQNGRLSLVFRSRPERWYDAAIVVDDAPSMDIWHDTLIEFERLLLETGAFRDVRTWRLAFKGPGDASKPEEPELRSVSGARLSPVGLTSGYSRRLIFFATHGISERWANGTMGRLLDAWSRDASVAILHMLPPDLWSKTTLGEPDGLSYSPAAGARTADLAFEQFGWELLDDERAAVAIPVIPLEHDACGEWARMQMARGARAPAVLVGTETVASASDLEDDLTPTDHQLVSLLRSHGSPEAFNLAVYMAAGPFTLPIARLIQAAKFGARARQSQIAELFLSGLVHRNTPLDARVHPDSVQYEILESARPLLLRSLTEDDAESLLSTLQVHVGSYIEQSYGSPVDFRALVRDPSGAKTLPAYAQPFAAIGTALVRLRDGDAVSDTTDARIFGGSAASGGPAAEDEGAPEPAPFTREATTRDAIRDEVSTGSGGAIDGEPDAVPTFQAPEPLPAEPTAAVDERQPETPAASTPEPITAILYRGTELPDPAAPVGPPWTVPADSERANMLVQINQIDGKYPVSLDKTQLVWVPLPYYKEVALVRLKDARWPAGLCVFYLTLAGNLFRLNGSSAPIHDVNATAPIMLTESNVLEYLRFFTFFVRGDEGPFYILERPDDPLLGQMDDTTRSVVNGTARSAKLMGRNDEGHFLVEAVISYSNAIFIAQFAIQPTGMIEMTDDEPIAADLPVRVMAPVA